MTGSRVAITRLSPDTLHRTPGYAHVTIVDGGRLAFLAGQCPLDRDGRIVGRGDVSAQVDQVVANALAALSATGASSRDVVKSVIYVASEDPTVLSEVWNRLTASPLGAAFTTASTLLGVAGLGHRDQIVEIDLIAALPD